MRTRRGFARFTPLVAVACALVAVNVTVLNTMATECGGKRDVVRLDE